MKRCTKCKKRKGKAEFHKDSSSKDGLSCWCKKCVHDYNRRSYRKKKGGRVRRLLKYEQRHRIVDGIKEKRCSRCRKWRAEADFTKDPRYKGGRVCQCKKCVWDHKRSYYGYSKKHLTYEQRHRVVGRVKQKRCGKCKKWKPESQFYKRREQIDGLAVRCKPCSDIATNKAHKKRLAANK